MFLIKMIKTTVLLMTAGAMLSLSALAAPLEWVITKPVESASPGETVVFSGNISNNTGFDLESTDLFLDFLAYDFIYITPNQELGFVPFLIPNFTESGNVALFNVEIAPFIVPDTYYLSVLLQDINGNLTDAIDVAIIVSEIPEPSVAILLLFGLITLLFISPHQSIKKTYCDVS